MAALAVALIMLAGTVPETTALLGLWSLLATSAPVAWWTWLSRTLPQDAEAGGGLMVAVVQFAITFGATVGGLAYDASGYQSTFGFAGALLIGSALLSVMAARKSN